MTFVFLSMFFNILFFSNTDTIIKEGVFLEGQECFKIKTSVATYYYQKDAGGFASIIDEDGNDWVTFKKSDSVNYPYSAANEYRGFPNLVYGGEDDGSGHPGFDNCISELKNDSTIVTVTKNKKWKWEIVFHDTYLELNILQIDTSRAYWVLYEGTPGGKYDPVNFYWGNNIDGLCDSIPDFYKGPIKNGNWSWAYFGSKEINRILFIAQKKPDNKNDMFGLLGNTKNGINSPDGMTVFGFGRDGINPKLSSINTFYLGFYDNKILDEVSHASVLDYLKLKIIN